MKKLSNIIENTPVIFFLTEIGFSNGKASRQSAFLKKYRILTVGQMIGAFCPNIPKLSTREIKNKGILCSSRTLESHKKPSYIISKLRKTLKLTQKEAQLIFYSFKLIPQSTQSYRFNFNWSLGGQKKETRSFKSEFWLSSPAINISKGFHVIPFYEDAGKVFDQGDRGTCVANATCTLLDYKSSKKTSRQFLYHQCKMIDGIPNKEGTFIEIPFKILNNSVGQDFGCTEESTWSYNPKVSERKHQGPPPEKAFNCKRLEVKRSPIRVRKSSMISDIKYLLNFYNDGKTCPVVSGIPLYESFNSYSTSTTGWVTIPLPGEVIVGYHAMIIVGYDEDRELFLVRNSWGTAWASNNDKGYAGHAWIPYEYIRKYAFDLISIESIEEMHLTVFPEYRLYNNRSVNYKGRMAAAAKKNSKKRKLTGKKHKISIGGWFIRAAVIILLWNTYTEPIKRFASKAIEFVNSNIDFEQLHQKANTFFSDNLNNNYNF